ncbi:MAG: helix-turn-helix transcriptional regulator, partial [Gemmataceae bacterium]|nr:helix-turn-helix transcriptional regulator [Gemmataceae bacterium]MCI0738803.1 helix-turn-helix transcriptional regulator [Gemmataceae bacterium]
IAKPNLSRLENDKVTPKFETLRTIAGALGTHPAMLVQKDAWEWTRHIFTEWKLTLERGRFPAHADTLYGPGQPVSCDPAGARLCAGETAQTRQRCAGGRPTADEAIKRCGTWPGMPIGLVMRRILIDVGGMGESRVLV